MQEKFALKAIRAIKKVAALSTGVAMLGATMTGALAADLSDYPAPYVVNGVPDPSLLIALGDLSAASDTIGATDIALGLQNVAKVAAGGGTTVAVSGGETEEIPINKSIADASIGIDANLEDDDVSTLLDSITTFQSADYDIREVVVLSRSTPHIATALASQSALEEDYGSGIFLEVSKSNIGYYYAFDDAINLSKATTADPLEIKFLGQTLKITKVDSTDTTKFTARVGGEYFMDVGDSVVVIGKKITLINVGSGGSISVDVDGVVEIIGSGGTETINGLEVTNDETFYEDNKQFRSANLIMGKDSQDTFKNADAYPGEDETDPNWVWKTGGLGLDASTGVPLNMSGTDPAGTPTLAIENDFVLNDAGDNPPGVGECIDLPNNYISICLDSLTIADDKYAEFVIELSPSTDFSDVGGGYSGQTAEPSIYIHTGVDDGIRIESDHKIGNTTNFTTDIKTKEVWLSMNDTNQSVDASWVDIFYKHKDEKKVRYAGAFQVDTLNQSGVSPDDEILYFDYGNTKDTNIELTLGAYDGQNNSETLNLTLDVVGDSTNRLGEDADDLVMVWGTDNLEFNKLGTKTSEAEGLELSWQSGGTNRSIGDKNTDLRLSYGTIIKNTRSNGNSDEVRLLVPEDLVEVNVVVKGTTTQVASGGASFTLNPLPDPISVLESEIKGSEAQHNLIVVGGPAVNKLAEKFLGLTADQYRATYKAGEAVLKVAANGNKVALVVAGYNADDTRRASKVLQNYGSFTLTGSEALVKGTSLNVEDIQVS